MAVEVEAPVEGMDRRESGIWVPTAAELRRTRHFARYILRQDHYPKQEELLDAIDDHPRVAVKGAHGVGKTRAIASAALAFLLRYADAVVLATAPTLTQVKLLVMAQVHKVLRQSGVTLPTVLEQRVAVSREQYLLGLATNEGIRFQGFHSGHIMVIFDEAPGVMGEIWKAVEGIMAGGFVRLVASGNPVESAGEFYDAFPPETPEGEAGEESDWYPVTISAFDSPNLLNEAEGRPYTLEELEALPPHELEAEHPRWKGLGLAGRRWVRDMHRKHGADGTEYVSRVLGRFPNQAPNALMSRSWLQEAKRLGHFMDPGADYGGDMAWTAGIDVAGEGDAETVVSVWQGDVIRDIGRFSDSDARQVVLDFLAPYAAHLQWGPPRPAVRVDSVGQGWYFLQWLQEQPGYAGHVLGVNVGEAADALIRPHMLKERAEAKARFADLKARLYWGLRERFREGRVIAVAFPPAALDQCAGIRYHTTPKGRIEIESKKQARARGVQSPDIAESLMLGGAPLGTMPLQSSVSFTKASPGRGRSSRRGR